MIVLEANIQCEDTDYLTWTPGYNMILTKAMQSMGYSRLVALVREGIQVEVEETTYVCGCGQYMAEGVQAGWQKNCIFAGYTWNTVLLRQHILNNTDEILLQNLYILKWTSPDHQHISMINMVKNDI